MLDKSVMSLIKLGKYTGIMIIQENSSEIYHPDRSREEDKDFRPLTHWKKTCITECFQVDKVRHEKLIEAVIFNGVEQIKNLQRQNLPLNGMLVIGFHHNATYLIGYLLGQPSVNVSETDEKLATPAHYCALHDSIAYIRHFSDEDLVARDIRVAQKAPNVLALPGPVLFPSLLLSYFRKWPKSSKKVPS